MPGFEIYEVLSGTKLFPPNEDSRMSLNDTEFKKQLRNNIQERTLLLAFVRMSSKRKMNLLTNMFQQVRNIRILADVLNIFFSVNTKLISYSKISTDSNTLYEQFVNDDDRLMDADTLEECVLSNREWFNTLEDTDQMDVITSLLRLSGGNIIKKMYIRLMKIFNKRNSEEKQNYMEYKSSSNLIFPDNCNEKLIKVSDFQSRYIYQDEENDYNPDCPTSKKVLEARKQWQISMAKVRKEIEIEVQRLNEPIIRRMKGKESSKELDSVKPKDSRISKDTDATKKATTVQDTDIDWIQFLPLWTVKKIFSYLDEKTLHNLKSVNGYWATISREVLVEHKAREYIDATLKKSKEFLDNLVTVQLSQTQTDIRVGEIKTEPSGYKKRMERQRRTGTFLRRKEKDAESIQTKCALSECFKEFDTLRAAFLTKLRPFPIDVPTVITGRPEEEADRSANLSLSEVTSLRVLKTQPAIPPKPSAESEERYLTSTSSRMSLVPSIVVSVENKETW